MGFISKLLKKYKDRINYNKELAFAELGALAAGPVAGQLASYATGNNAFIAIAATIGDYLGYTLTFALSSFFDNRKLYWSHKKRIHRLFYKHMLEFIGGAAVVDMLYYGARIYVAYLLLSSGIAPYLAIFISQLITLFFYFGLMNVMGSLMGIVKKKE